MKYSRTRIRTHVRNFCAAFALLAMAWGVRGGAQTAAVRPAGTTTAPSAPQPIYPLSQVHRGLHGTAYTVFEGSKPEAIDLEVLGVLRNAIGPGKDMILARLLGSKPEYMGVVAGMSGSPVYIDGKLVGAIGFRIGQFTKQPIAGITPIQQMFEVLDSGADDTTARASSAQADRASANVARVDDSSVSRWPRGSAGMLQPIETPLVFDGYSSAAIDLFERHVPSLGLTPVSGLGGANPDAPDPAPVVPGSAISAIIVSGDFNMAATCTVTYVDPKRLLACGHPITHFGSISLPMTKAVVVATVASSLNPMKIINTTETIGSFTEDRGSGVLGIFGKTAPMIPVALTIRGPETHSRAQQHTYHFSVVEHPRLTSGALIASVFQAMQDTNSHDDPSTYNLTGEIVLAGHAPVRIDDWIAPTSQQTSSLAAALAIAKRFDSIFSNPRNAPDILSVSLTLHTFPGQQSAVLATAHVLSPTAHAGGRATIEAVLDPYRQPQRVVRLDVQLPETLTPGPVRLLVSDGTTLDHTLHLTPGPTAVPARLDETISRLNRLHPNNRLYVTLLTPVPQATVQGRSMPAIPLTMANVLESGTESAESTLNGETAIPLGSKDLNLALSGARVLSVDVKP